MSLATRTSPKRPASYRKLWARKGLQGLVNSAGIIVEGPLELTSTVNFRRQMEVNVTGRFAVARAMLPALRKGRGRIVNIGALLGTFDHAALWRPCGGERSIRRDQRYDAVGI